MKKKLYLVEWDNGTISIISAQNKTELFWSIDAEGDPYDTKIVELSFSNDIHITTNSESKIDWDLNYDSGDVKKKVVHDKKKRLFGSLNKMLNIDGETPDEVYQAAGFSKP